MGLYSNPIALSVVTEGVAPEPLRVGERVLWKGIEVRIVAFHPGLIEARNQTLLVHASPDQFTSC